MATETAAERSARLLADLTSLERGTPAWERARDAAIEGHGGLVVSCAQRFLGRGEPLEDLVQVGTIGLIKAVDRFDGERAVGFSSFAVPTIVGEIRRHLRDRTRLVKVPRTVTDRYATVSGAVEALTVELGRSPTPGQVADRLGLDVGVVVEALEAMATAVRSLDVPVGDGDGARSVADLVGAVDAGFDEVEVRYVLEVASRTLSDRDRLIVRRRVEEGAKQSEIATEVGLSQMQVSRILRRFASRVQDALAGDAA